MFECLIIGDSIAVGTKMHAPQQCAVMAKSGITSSQWNNTHGSKKLNAQTVIISLGTNDWAGSNTEKALRLTRTRAKADRVVWIMPPCNDKFCKPSVNDIVKTIAREFGDMIISTPHLQPDKIHPSGKGYQDLVKKAFTR